MSQIMMSSVSVLISDMSYWKIVDDTTILREWIGRYSVVWLEDPASIDL